MALGTDEGRAPAGQIPPRTRQESPSTIDLPPGQAGRTGATAKVYGPWAVKLGIVSGKDEDGSWGG